MVEKHEVLEARSKNLLKTPPDNIFSALGVICLIIALLSLFQCTD